MALKEATNTWQEAVELNGTAHIPLPEGKGFESQNCNWDKLLAPKEIEWHKNNSTAWVNSSTYCDTNQ